MSDHREQAEHIDDEKIDIEEGFSEDEKSQVRSYIDDLAVQNRIPAEEAVFKRDARSGVLIPFIVNAAAVLGILIGILVLRAAFQREEQDVQSEAVAYASIEGRLIRELREESQELILEKEREIEQVRRQLEQLEEEQIALEDEIERRIAQREEELRRELEAELESERTRLIAEGLDNDEIERLMESFEAEREQYYEQQLAAYRAELEQERAALQEEIDGLRAEYQRQLARLESERQEIVDEYRQRESELRVQLEQRTRVLEIARVEATANLEEAQRELAELQRERENVQSVQNQIIGQIEQIQAALQTESGTTVLGRIDQLISFLGNERVLELEPLARRRAMDLFLLRQLRDLVEERVEAQRADERSITEELRLISRIRRLSEQAAGAPSDEAATERFRTLLDTLPEVSRAHEQVVARVREEAVEQVRETEREIVQERAASAATLSAAGDYELALDSYVSALSSLPAVAPDTDAIVQDVLRLGYALTDYVIDGQQVERVGAIADRAAIDIEQEREDLQRRIENAVEAAVATREAELELIIAERDDLIRERDQRIQALNEEITSLGAQLAAFQEREAETPPDVVVMEEQELEALNARVRALDEQSQELTNRLAALRTERDRLEDERDNLEIQRDQLVDERSQLRARYTEYAQAQEEAINEGDFVALANARDAFFFSSELDLFMPGLSDLIDEYNQQFAAEQETTGLSAFAVNEILQELSGPLTNDQRRLLLEDAITGAREDGDETFAEFLSLLAGVVTDIAGE